MRRRLLSLLTALSLVLCVAAAALWVRSLRSHDTVEAARSHNTVAVESAAGRVSFLYDRAKAQSFPSHWAIKRHHYPEFIWDPSLIPPHLSILGIEWRTMTTPASTFHALTVPYWTVLAIAAVTLLLSLRRIAQRRSRRCSSRCAECGYDLRATPGRCPECGAASVAAPAPN